MIDECWSLGHTVGGVEDITMGELARMAISLDEQLLVAFDHLCERLGYTNRSEAIRDLIRAKLVDEAWQADPHDTVAALSLVYNHEASGLAQKLTHLQHENHANVVSSLHVHLDHHNCLEVLVLRGPGNALRKIGDRLLATKGVKHGQLMMTTTGRHVH